jgi:hypothetical protein
MDVCAEESVEKPAHPSLSLSCTWLDSSVKGTGNESHDESGTKRFALPLPLKHCLDMLKQFASMEGAHKTTEQTRHAESTRAESVSNSEHPLTWNESAKLWAMNVEGVDFNFYCHDVSEQTKHAQANASFRVICTAIASLLKVDDITTPSCRLKVKDVPKAQAKQDTGDSANDETASSHQVYNSQHAQARKEEFLCMNLGVMYSCIIDATSVEAMTYLKGFACHIFFTVISYHGCFQRIDAHGSSLEDSFKSKTNAEGTTDGKAVEDERLGALKPFGYFLPVKQLREAVNPLVFNEALAEFLALKMPGASNMGLEIVRHLLAMAKETGVELREGQDETTTAPSICVSSFHRGVLVFFENLISHLSTACITHAWHRKEGLYEAIVMILDGLGDEFGLQYEEEIMILAFFVVKCVPRELPTTSVRAFRFLVRVCCRLYGRPVAMDGSKELIWDSLAVKVDKDSQGEKSDSEPTPKDEVVRCPCSAVIQVAITELASQKHISR